MEQILNKLSEIELTAQRIMEDCDRQKQQLSEEAEQKCKNYDEQLESRTAEQIRRIRQQLEEEKDSRLAQLRADTDATFSSLDAHYEQQHSQLSRELFEKILEIAKEYHINAVAEGSNMDDNGDYRPGMKAIHELGVLSPLQTAGFTKQEIRDVSEELGLPTWNKPSFACLASRFVYGEKITAEKLERVGKAEQILRNSGFKQFRVRIHGDIARIELLPEDFEKMLKMREELYASIKALGFSYVTMDLQGYRTGSMNEVIATDK